MNQNQIKKNKSKGFSLVELIVVIAIMAVMAAVLAPSLLSYVEKSRAQKDNSVMSEITNAIQLALADQDVFDEVLTVTVKLNASCYVDKTNPDEANIVALKDGGAAGPIENQYMYNDEERKVDEIRYMFAGSMRGTTITFVPDVVNAKKTKFTIADGIVNMDHALPLGPSADPFGSPTPVGPRRAPLRVEDITLGTLGGSRTGHLYNQVRAAVGDYVELSSQTYKNSNYTVFIKMGGSGGNQVTAQDATKVYGQWNGTNLDENSAGVLPDDEPPGGAGSGDLPALPPVQEDGSGLI